MWGNTINLNEDLDAVEAEADAWADSILNDLDSNDRWS